MKRILSLLLVLVLALSLCACKSEEAKNAEALIAAIGEVTPDSEAAIIAAEEAYAALTDDDKASIENLAVLTAARTACDAAKTESLIAAIGEVTLDSEAAITAAEEAYAALGEDAKALVTSAADLTAARAAYDEAAAFETMRLSLAGRWVNEVIGDGALPTALEDTNCEPDGFYYTDNEGNDFSSSCLDFELREDGTFVLTNEIGTWALSEDMTTVSISIDYGELEPETFIFQVMEEGGYTRLVGGLFENAPFGYVHAEEYEAAYNVKYATVELTDENFRDYIGESVYLGEFSVSTGNMRCYFFPSEAYDDGLVYMGCACSVNVKVTHKGAVHNSYTTFPVITGWLDNITAYTLDDGASGQMFYVKAEYVADNYINDDGCRTLVLTNGITMVFDGYGSDNYDTFWSIVDADYEDYIF